MPVYRTAGFSSGYPRNAPLPDTKEGKSRDKKI
jgi:hypothetical protein